MAAPSFRTRGKNHGLTAILGSVEEDSWMDKIRQLMVNFDAAVVELKRAQEELNRYICFFFSFTFNTLNTIKYLL